MRDHRPQDHDAAEDDEDDAVALGAFGTGSGGAEGVVGGEDLHEDGAEFARRGGDAVAGGAVAGGEDFAGDDVGGGVGACGVWWLVDLDLNLNFGEVRRRGGGGAAAAARKEGKFA